MSVDIQEVKKLAQLARINIADDQWGQYQSDLSKILDFVEQLSALNTDTVEPMAGAHDMCQRLRDDVIADGGYPEKLMQNAPDSTLHFFTVPKVVE